MKTLKTYIKTCITISLAFSFSFISFSSDAQCHVDDWNALKAIYESLDGEDWWYQGGWNQVTAASPPASCNLSNLRGVELDASGRVTELDLNTNFLRGNIPPEIGNLSNLKVLNFHYNLLEGPIPPEIGNLTNLTHVNLGASTGSNDLTGNIPPEIGNLSNLQELNLRGNDLVGTIPVGLTSLDDLTKLDLAFNNLTGTLLPEFGNMLNLEHLSLDWNNLIGEIPDEFGNFTSIEWLSLSSNQLTGTIPVSLGNLSNLRFLALSGNNLTGNIPVELSNLTNLRNLFIGNNELSGCYDNELLSLYYQLDYPCSEPCGDPIPEYDYTEGNTNESISYGNNFDAHWYDFGTCFSGACEEQTILNLDGVHDSYRKYSSSETIYSTAVVNSSIQYTAGERIRLNSGFKTNNPHYFNASISSCQ